MKVGILGASKLAASLGHKLLNSGVEVIFGVRDDFEAREVPWKMLKNIQHRVFGYKDAIRFADIILICCDNDHLLTVCGMLAKTDLTNKTLVDCTNPRVAEEKNSNYSLVSDFIDQKSVYKAFNNLGIDYPCSDILGLIKETYFCGPEGTEKLKVKRLIELTGFKPIDAGGSSSAFLLEAFYHLSQRISQNKKEKMEYHFKLISV